MDDIRIGIAGAGRMGQAVSQAVDAANGVCVSKIWSRGESLAELVADSNVLVDFSLPEATADVLASVQNARIPLVTGVSGLDAAQIAAMEQASTVIPIVFDRNMSQGVTVLADLVQRAAKSLGAEFEVEIREVHHVHKLDSPSGTALKLGESIDAVRGAGGTPVRYEVERRGEVPGDHSVVFSSPTETLTFEHSVTTRQVFAEGALRAARWVVQQPPGLYQMRHVLFGDP
ncbi:MAG: 4-hydroxy-tetrahydrodipicolinate reductase [Woeseiaceae bacterium]